MFLWKVLNNGLMVNQKRFHNLLAESDLCPLCGTWSESMLHALRDCPVIKPVWIASLPGGMGSTFFSVDLQGWVTWNMKGGLQGWDKNAWTRRFTISTYCIWRMRNDVVFNNARWDHAQVQGWINASLCEDDLAVLDDTTGPTSSHNAG